MSQFKNHSNFPPKYKNCPKSIIAWICCHDKYCKQADYYQKFKNMYKKDLWRPNIWCNGGSTYSKKENTLKFDPPCYQQRYGTVSGVIRDEIEHKIGVKVVEFGCATLKFFPELKHISAIEHVIEVDIDEDLLKNCSDFIQPKFCDYIRQRERPLLVQIMAGSVADYDGSLEKVDVVVAIELIEHLHLDVLEKVPENIFKNIQPELAIITTPNADFNAAIPNFSGFRHDDHKFEWTRKEFTEWAIGITEIYSNYSVLFYGIGRGPEGTEELGCCSQMAVFKRKPFQPKIDIKSQNNYKLIKEYTYPMDTSTIEDRILGQVSSHIFYVSATYNRNHDEETDYEPPTEIPLKSFLPFLTHLCTDVKQLRKILESAGRVIKGTDENPMLCLEPEPESSDEDEYFDNRTEELNEPQFRNWTIQETEDDWN